MPNTLDDVLANVDDSAGPDEDALSYGSTRWPTEEDLESVTFLLDALVEDLNDIPRGLRTLEEAMARHRYRVTT